MTGAYDFDDDPPPDLRPFRGGGGGSGPKGWLLAIAVAAVIGAAFAAVSSSDFITHLDRQVHSIHCSFIPGAGQVIGDSGCRAVMMSPYSSVLRKSLWGGLPISVLALAVFAFLAFRAVELAWRRTITRADTGFLVAATALPVLMSVIYGGISMIELDAVCKLCVGIYVASTAGFILAIVAHVKAPAADRMKPSLPIWAMGIAQGVGYVAVMVLIYVSFAPVASKSAEGCGALVKGDDNSGVVIPLSKSKGGVTSIAVLDPLCPACRAFDRRLAASGLDSELSMGMVLFPLDATCNWMVKESIHPGACAVSEAMLCDPDRAPEILEWAFQNQEALLAQAKSSERDLRLAIQEKFTSVGRCLGSPKIKNKLNKSLRWAVANALPVLTPQLFVGDRRLCDEDTDLGLEYTITRLIEHAKTSRPAR